MARGPSVKTLMEGLGLTSAQAKELKALMAADKNALVAYDRMTGGKTHGVESFGLPDGCFANCQTPDVDVAYVNTGDTYGTTLLKVNGTYRVGNWGDIVEAYDNRH